VADGRAYLTTYASLNRFDHRRQTRIEGVALQEWHAAIPDYRVVSDTRFTYHGGSVFAIEHLPLEWDV